MEKPLIYKAGSRKSELALIQTNSVIKLLQRHKSGCEINVHGISTKGDKILDLPLSNVGKRVFTKELEENLTNDSVDLVVHSMKDVSTTLPDGLVIGAVLEREDPRDAVMTRLELRGKKLSDLPQGSVVGTSSLRRAAQLRRNHPKLLIKDIRGNLNTRLSKLDRKDGEYSAIVLALAGIRRMGWEDRVTEILDPEDMLYAVGQGALAVQCRSTDRNMLTLLEPLCHWETTLRIIAERSFMKTLGGGCTAPLAVDSKLDSMTLTLTGGVWTLDGSTVLLQSLKTTLDEPEVSEPPRKQGFEEPKEITGIISQTFCAQQLATAEKLGVDLASKLIKLGAAEIIEEAKRTLQDPVIDLNKIDSNGQADS